MPGAGGPRVLDLGCGQTKNAGAIGVDIVPTESADVVADFDRNCLPFRESCVDRVVMWDVLEHMTRIPQLMAEIHRVLRPGGLLQISVPHYSHPRTYGDPTHTRHFSFRTLEYLTGESHAYYGGGHFRVARAMLGQPSGSRLRNFVNRWPYAYELTVARVLPVRSMFWELVAVK